MLCIQTIGGARSKDDDGQFEKERDQLAADGLSVDNWHTQFSETRSVTARPQGNDKLWSSGKTHYQWLNGFWIWKLYHSLLPTTSFFSLRWADGEHRPGIQYETEYFPFLCTELKNGVAANSYRLAANEFWVNSQANQERLENFAKKYYTSVVLIRKYLGLWISIKLFKFPE